MFKTNINFVPLMKTSATILISIFTFFTIQSVVLPTVQPKETITHSQKSCCSHSKHKSCNSNAVNNKGDKQKPCEGCNTFMFCPLCLYTVPNQLVLDKASIGFTVENKNVQEDLFLSAYPSDCWHPPKLFLNV